MRSVSARGRWLFAGAAAIASLALVAFVSARRGEPAIPTASYVNQLGGYRLEYPREWTATSMGATTKFSSPERDVVVGVGRAPVGSLARASTTFTGTVLRAYSDVRVGGEMRQTIDGRRALLVAGQAVNLTGASVRWMTITMTGDPNLGISVFTRADSDPERLLPMLHALIGSVEPAVTG